MEDQVIYLPSLPNISKILLLLLKRDSKIEPRMLPLKINRVAPGIIYMVTILNV